MGTNLARCAEGPGDARIFHPIAIIYPTIATMNWKGALARPLKA